MLMITNPKQLDVVVTENLFRDILSDEPASCQGRGESALIGQSFGCWARSLSIHGPPRYCGQGGCQLTAYDPFCMAMMLGDSLRSLKPQEAIEASSG